MHQHPIEEAFDRGRSFIGTAWLRFLHQDVADGAKDFGAV
jgi:hypothetical protein